MSLVVRRALRGCPKLLPLYAVYGLLRISGVRISGARISLADVTRHLPRNIYDVRKVDGLRFGIILFRPSEWPGSLFEPFDQKAFFKVKPRMGDVVLDVGASVGNYSLRYSRLVGDEGQVLAFEPEPESRRFLSWNIRLNKAQNIRVRAEALGDFTGSATLKVSPIHLGGSTFVSQRVGIDHTGEIIVPVRRLDELSLSKVDLIKIDVEGYEISVLKGAENTISTFRPRMQIEVHGKHLPTCKVCSWLEDRGFSTRIIHERFSGRIHWIDVS